MFLGPKYMHHTSGRKRVKNAAHGTTERTFKNHLLLILNDEKDIHEGTSTSYATFWVCSFSGVQHPLLDFKTQHKNRSS
jgi:hypothetical protein